MSWTCVTTTWSQWQQASTIFCRYPGPHTCSHRQPFAQSQPSLSNSFEVSSSNGSQQRNHGGTVLLSLTCWVVSMSSMKFVIDHQKCPHYSNVLERFVVFRWTTAIFVLQSWKSWATARGSACQRVLSSEIFSTKIIGSVYLRKVLPGRFLSTQIKLQASSVATTIRKVFSAPYRWLPIFCKCIVCAFLKQTWCFPGNFVPSQQHSKQSRVKAEFRTKARGGSWLSPFRPSPPPTVAQHQSPKSTHRRVMHQSTQHGAMLHSLPYQGIVLTLLPFLPSPHRCIKRSTSVWRGYDLFFLANLVIHSTDKLLFTRKHQWWARSAWLPYQVMCNIPSLPSYSVVISTQGLFQVISRPFGLICEEPLFEISRWIPARSPRH